MKKIKFIAFLLLSFPKTLLFNLITFPFFVAMKVPVIIGYNVKVYETHRGCIVFSNRVKKIRFGMIRFGFGGPLGVVSKRRGEVYIERSGKLIVDGNIFFGEGSSLRISGTLHVGANFSASKNSYVNCSAEMSTIGDNVMLGWDVTILDGDGHTVYQNNIPKPTLRPYHIGNHVWICAEARLLKGVKIPDNSIVGFGSLVTKSFDEAHCLIAGTPAKVVQHQIDWGPMISGKRT